MVTRIVRGWGLWGKLYLLTCPRESHFSPGPLTTHCLLVSWVEGLASHKAPGFPLPLWELFLQAMGCSDWEHAEGNALTLRLFQGLEQKCPRGRGLHPGKEGDPGEKPPVLASPTSLMEVPLVSALLSLLSPGLHSGVWRGTGSRVSPWC